MGPTAAIGNGCQCWTCRRHWTTRPVPDKSRRQPDRASWGGRWGLHGQPLPSESNQIASWKPYRAADLTRRDNSHNRHMQGSLPAYCQLLIANCLVEGNWRYVDIVCSIRMNAIRCKCDARLGFLQSTLHQYRCLFCFWPLAKRRFHFPFSGGRGDYTGPDEE